MSGGCRDQKASQGGAAMIDCRRVASGGRLRGMGDSQLDLGVDGVIGVEVVVVVVWLQAVTGAGAPGNIAAPDVVPLIGQKVGGTAYQKCACGWLL